MPTKWKLGDKIQNRWEIYNIMRGGMGIVYVVYDYEYHVPLAAKTYKDELFNTPQIADRFMHEAYTWINLDRHQNVTPAYYVQIVQGKPFLFMEYVSSGDLTRWIGTPRLIENLSQILRFGVNLCDGMIHARSKGVKVHRDIKPQNCLVTQEGILKITDFGLAKLFEDTNLWITDKTNLDVKTRITDFSYTGNGLGTLTHMAPEQFDNAKHVDVQADIYAFGVMLYQMITGKLPFVGSNWREFKYLHENQAVPELEVQNSKLETIIQTCLAKKPDRRFIDFITLRENLKVIYEELTDDATPTPMTGNELDAMEWTTKGASMGNLCRYEESLACHEKAIELNPNFELAWINKGALLGKGLFKWQDAIKCYDIAIDLNPQNASAWNNKGTALGTIGKPNDALACFHKALEINPLSDEAWMSKGEVLRMLDQTTEAIACHERAIELNPYNENPWYNKGVVLMELGRREEAIACYDKAIMLNPRYDWPLINKGIVLFDLDRYENAMTCFDKAIELNPSNDKTWFNKGILLGEKLGLWDKAIPCYDQALILNPNYLISWNNKGIALYHIGKYLEAITCYDYALANNPQYSDAWLNKSTSLIEIGQYEEALHCLEQILQLNPNDVDAWINKGSVFAYLNRYEEALVCFDRALTLSPRDVRIWFNKSVVLKESGQLLESLACVKKAQEIGM
ncbi:MAG: tetratricopeptide repeat protein [Desulfobacterales bacterium]|nr:tetratricopeptide repeat protein [Desulfobacterales bacterium]